MSCSWTAFCRNVMESLSGDGFSVTEDYDPHDIVDNGPVYLRVRVRPEMDQLFWDRCEGFRQSEPNTTDRFQVEHEGRADDGRSIYLIKPALGGSPSR